MTVRRRLPLLLAFVVLITAVLTSGTAAQDNSGFKTSRPSMLTAVKAGVQVTPLLTVGDALSSGYRFEAIPDGISVMPRGQGRVDLLVNHETSKVPFPYLPANWQANPGESQNDFDNAQVSRLIVNQHSAGVLNGSFAIASSAGYQRFCSNYLATEKEGFDRDILFTNEETPDYVARQENSWFVPPGSPQEREAGLAVALDAKNGKHQPIYGMGRHNHENSVAIPGFDDLVVLSGDDTFTSGPLTIPAGGPLTAGTRPAQSQLYSYVASDTDSLLADEGELWAFVSNDASFNDYYDFVPGSAQSVSGHFVQVPKNIATGLDTDGTELKASDVGFPAPPSDGSWQRDLRSTTTPQAGIDGPQWVLEYWSQLNNVFQFVRVEDVAYDKRPGMENIVYVVDSGRGTAGASQPGRSTNGRVWKMVLDRADPTVVTSFSVFVEGDDNEVKTPGEVHQPDNLETTATGLLITEDPGSSQQFTPAQQVSDAARATTARLWYVPFSGAPPEIVVKVNQGLDELAGYDVDPPDRAGAIPSPAFPISPGNWGAWETSGIVDASAAFGPGSFLIDVQAHTLWVDKADGFDTPFDADSIPDFSFKREGGQLLLLRIPGM
jgi:hypothetical protein